MFLYSSSSLESIRFDTIPPVADRNALLASGWERHPHQHRLYLLRKEVRAIRLSNVASFVLPVDADWYDKSLRRELFMDAKTA